MASHWKDEGDRETTKRLLPQVIAAVGGDGFAHRDRRSRQMWEQSRGAQKKALT